MDSPLLLPLIGLIYTVLFGGLSLLRRESLSLRFALEALALTALATLLALATPLKLHPVLFLLLLYVLTMRVRLLVDVGNSLAGRGRFELAERVYQFALRLGPDTASRLIVHINQGVLRLQQRRLEEAIAGFQQVLQQGQEGFLGVKHEAGTHYNLAVAYRRQGMETQAADEFRKVLETWPASEYARHAQAALKRVKE